MNAGRFALSAITAAALCAAASSTWALGLGRLSVQSALGETMKAEIDVTSLSPEEASSLKVRVAPPDAYRAAGVDYNPVLPNTQATIQHRPDGRVVLRLSSDRAVQEPFVDVILEVSWSTGRLVREYTLLFDPPSNRTAPPASATTSASPSISAAPTPAPSTRSPSPAPAPATTAEAPAPAPAATARPSARRVGAAPSPAPAAQTAEGGANEVTVKPGDTLYRIATRTQRQGVSLDQMLVSLYRGNPTAFIDNNMNRLKAGVVLAVPTSETAQQVTNAEARQVIQAQSSDFGSYRQKLASAVPSARTEEPTKQATGKVQASVEDRKQTAQTSPDRLTLSQGSIKASSPEAKIAKEAERKEASQRVAELSRNVEELKRLSGKPAATAPTPAPAPKATPAAPAPAPAPVAKAAAPAPAPAPAKLPTLPVPTKAPVVVPPAPVVASAPVSTAPMAASQPALAASQPSAAASALASAPHPVVAASKPRPRPRVVPQPIAEPSFFDNPLALPAAALVLVGIGAAGFLRWRSRSRKDSGETSFLESRLQPDSFFGASGGQRIDTRDASGVSSSMSYSLSQLDAIGDVDPVAEADVYLAYGRDLQAEEILKEAMRSNPDRLAIRTKLLEVYAKRRDTKGFEALATQLYALTRGEGEDWAKAQELGRQIDADNPLYQPGGHPADAKPGEPPQEPLGASTMPASVQPMSRGFEPPPAPAPAPVMAPPPTAPAGDLDLNLDAPDLSEREAAAAAPAAKSSLDLDFDLPAIPPAPAQPAPAPMEFDLNSLSLDLDTVRGTEAAMPAPEVGDLELPDMPGEAIDASADPLARKLELAEEFRQIGDMEGARDLLEEVVAKANGSLKAKAQGMLEELA